MVRWFVIDLYEKTIHGPCVRAEAVKMAKRMRKESSADIGLEFGTNIVVLNETDIVDKLQGK